MSGRISSKQINCSGGQGNGRESGWPRLWGICLSSAYPGSCCSFTADAVGAWSPPPPPPPPLSCAMVGLPVVNCKASLTRLRKGKVGSNFPYQRQSD